MNKQPSFFEESRILFEFGNSWDIVAFDKTKFYKTISGLGVKGVDFLGIYENRLYFIEVKNFTQYNEIDESTFDFKAFRTKIIIKFEDSQRAIRLIHRHYSRKWWHKIRKFLPTRFISWMDKDYFFWEKSYQIMQLGADHHIFILWIEHHFNEATMSKEIEIPLQKYFGHQFSWMNSTRSVIKDLKITKLK